MSEMTQKERWMKTINMEPVDRLIFWPKIFNAYAPAQQSPFDRMTVDELHQYWGCDMRVFIPGYINIANRNASKEIINNNDELTEIYKTQYGEMKKVSKFDRASQSWHPVVMPINNLEDIKMMTAFYNDIVVTLDNDALEDAKSFVKTIGQTPLTIEGIGTSPLMHYIEWLAGIENGHYFLYDYPDAVEELFAAMHGVQKARTEIAAMKSPADLLHLTENTSTTLISVAQYEMYCFRHVNDYTDIIKNAGGKVELHMCGHLKQLLPMLSKLRADVFEAFTSPPLGDTTLLDGRIACPDTCLLGGTDATLWMKSAGAIIEQIEHDLDELPHHRGIALSPAGIMTPLCVPETIKAVCEWIKSYKRLRF